MDIKQLRYFVTVVEEGNITLAAKKLHMSQPPLSNQMKQLEDELNIQLMERGSRNIVLTDAGKILYERANTILKITDTTKQELLDYGNGLEGTLRLGVISSSGTALLNNRMLKFHTRYPNVRFEIHEGNTFQLIEMLNSSVIEVAVVRTPFKTDGFECIYLDKEPMVAIGHASFFMNTEQEIITIDDLKDKPLIYYRRFEPLIEKCFLDVDITPNIFCLNDDARTSLMWANAGLGIAIVPQSISQSIFSSNTNMICKIINQENMYTRVSIIHKKDGYTSNAAKYFLEVFSHFSNAEYGDDNT